MQHKTNHLPSQRKNAWDSKTTNTHSQFGELKYIHSSKLTYPTYGKSEHHLPSYLWMWYVNFPGGKLPPFAVQPFHWFCLIKSGVATPLCSGTHFWDSKKSVFSKGWESNQTLWGIWKISTNSFIYTRLYMQYVHNIDTIYPKYFKASMIANQPTILKIPIFLPDVPCLNLPPSS